MSSVAIKKDNSTNKVAIVKKMKNYSNEPAFKKKAADAIAFIKKHDLPKAFKKMRK